MAGQFLKAAVHPDDAPGSVIKMIAEVRDEIRICMFGVGAVNLEALQNTQLLFVQ
jgi:isopentenyl diphosphate isomerase/L-lactate dehydrogenase-like FMN-dependent dehydrogenase